MNPHSNDESHPARPTSQNPSGTSHPTRPPSEPFGECHVSTKPDQGALSEPSQSPPKDFFRNLLRTILRSMPRVPKHAESPVEAFIESPFGFTFGQCHVFPKATPRASSRIPSVREPRIPRRNPRERCERATCPRVPERKTTPPGYFSRPPRVPRPHAGSFPGRSSSTPRA